MFVFATRSLGELCSGPVTDAMMQRARRRALAEGTNVPAEIRLQGIWTGAIAVPAGLLMSAVLLLLLLSYAKITHARFQDASTIS